MEKDSKATMGKETLSSSNMDTISFHVALIGVSYMITNLTCEVAEFFMGQQPLLYGVFFAWAMFVAMGIRNLVSMTRWAHWLSWS